VADLVSVLTVVTVSKVATTAIMVSAEASLALENSNTVIKETSMSLKRATATATPRADMEVMAATPFVDMADMDLATAPGATATVPEATVTVSEATATAPDMAAMAASMVAGDQAASVPTEDAATAMATVTSSQSRSRSCTTRRRLPLTALRAA